MRAYIYALRDPRCNSIRYVGKTNYPKRRVWDHCSKQANANMKEWISALRQAGLRPLLEIIEECSMENWEEREIFWIAELKGQGNCLLNITAGGNGKGSHAPETVQKMTEFQRTPERRALQTKVGEATFSNPEYLKRLREGHAKWRASPETKKWQSETLKKRYKDPEFTRRRIAAWRKVTLKPVWKVCPETGNVLEKFPSAQEATKGSGMSWPSLSSALKNGTLAKGFYWRYADGFSYTVKPRKKKPTAPQNSQIP